MASAATCGGRDPGLNRRPTLQVTRRPKPSAAPQPGPGMVLASASRRCGTRVAVQAFQADPRITLQKVPRMKAGSLSASTSAFTVPNVVSGLCFMPS
jgi:hypothetical protein